MAIQSEILEMLRREPFYRRVQKREYFDGDTWPCKIFSRAVVDALEREFPAVRAIIVQNDNVVNARYGGECISPVSSFVKDHAYVAAFTLETGPFIIEPSAGQFLLPVVGSGGKRIIKPYDDIFIGTRAELLVKMHEHGLTERDILRTWAMSTVPYFDQDCIPDLDWHTVWSKANGDDIPFIVQTYGNDRHELAARQAFRLKQRGFDWKGILLKDPDEWSDRADIAARLAMIEEKNSVDIEFPPIEILKHKFIAAEQDLAILKGCDFDPEAAANTLAEICASGPDWPDRLKNATAATFKEIIRTSRYAHFRDAAELLALAKGHSPPPSRQQTIDVLEKAEPNSLYWVKWGAHDLIKKAALLLLDKIAEAEIGRLSQTLRYLPIEETVAAYQKHLLAQRSERQVDWETSAGESLERLAQLGAIVSGTRLSKDNRFASFIQKSFD